jgi:hypothetical protein
MGVAFAGAAPTATRAATPTTLFAFDAVHSHVGKTQNIFIAPPSGQVHLYAGATPEHIAVYAADDGDHWQLTMTAGSGESLVAGVYSASGADGSARLSLSGSGDACGASDGSFEIHEVQWDGPDLVRLALTYEYRCTDGGRGLVAGRVRINSSVPLPSFESPPEVRAMASVVAGGAGTPRTYTVTADGDLPVTFGALRFIGTDGGSFTIGDDGCSGETLDPGESCTWEVAFTPEASGGRTAWLEIPHDGNLSPRRLLYWGIGLIPTTTTVVRVEPVSEHPADGVRYVFTVLPSPGGNWGECVIDGAIVTSSILAADGTGYCYAPRAVGSHAVQARYLESFEHATSELSPSATFDISNTTTTSVSATRTTAWSGEAVTFTATVATASNLLYPGGQLILRDGAAVLVSHPVTRADPTLSFTTDSLAPGTHTFTASYAGVPGSLEPSSSAVTVTVSPAPPDPVDPAAGVVDIAGTTFEADIRWLYTQGISRGCTPTAFCPNAPVSREQMASFLVRALGLPATGTDFFTDDEASIHEADINRLATAGITDGCDGTRFCPRTTITREQMASFLVRALGLPATSTDFFTDDEASIHEADNNRLAAAGITGGCSGNRFCPGSPVIRGQMAAFLRRALER